MRLSSLFEERGEFYANANARVSLESMSLFCFEIKIVKLSRFCRKNRKTLCMHLQYSAIFNAVLLLCADIAAKLGRSDASDLSPTAIAIEVLNSFCSICSCNSISVC